VTQIKHLKSRLGTSQQRRTRNSALEDKWGADNGGGKALPQNRAIKLGSRSIRKENERDDASMSNEE